MKNMLSICAVEHCYEYYDESIKLV